jgi:hypothetical protein
LDPEAIKPKEYARLMSQRIRREGLTRNRREPVEFALNISWATGSLHGEPDSATPPPQLTFKGTPFPPQDHPAPDLTNWGFDGQHFYRFRDRRDPIWRPLGEGWEVHYFGFLLAGDLDRWNRRLPLATSMRFEDFYD